MLTVPFLPFLHVLTNFSSPSCIHPEFALYLVFQCLMWTRNLSPGRTDCGESDLMFATNWQSPALMLPINIAHLINLDSLLFLQTNIPNINIILVILLIPKTFGCTHFDVCYHFVLILFLCFLYCCFPTSNTSKIIFKCSTFLGSF